MDAVKGGRKQTHTERRITAVMGKTVYMFPGQGAQYVGMAKEFYDRYQVCKAVFELASNVTGLDIPALCLQNIRRLQC